MSKQKYLSTENWAKKNFTGLDLGDKRRNNRVITLATQMASSPGKTIPQLFKKTYDVKAAYNLFRDEASIPDKLQDPHRKLVQEELSLPGTYLLIEDTSSLSWSGNAPVKGLGPIGKSTEGLQGFSLHSVLAVRWNKENSIQDKSPVEIIGLADQQYKVRSFERTKLKRKYSRENTEALESMVWENSAERLPSPSSNKNVRLVRVCDRGADIYEVLMQCLEKNYGFVIRAAYDRCLNNENEKLFSHIRSKEALGTFSLNLRSRGKQASRIADLSVSSDRIGIKSPQRPGYNSGGLSPVECSVVRVFEANPHKDTTPLEWILLCDQKIETYEEAVNCVKQYASRWLIEEYHKAIKTGLGAEKLQLETADRLFAAISIMCIVALRLIAIREQLRISKDNPARHSGLSMLELKVLEKYLDRTLNTVKDVGLAIGRLGGHLNRKSDGMPGMITLWKGMNRLLELVEGAKLFLDTN